jgi:ferric-dicitrate binding protein FerR (iron transport regulator)
MNEQIEKMLRESLDEETPEAADARILSAIRIEAVARRRWRRMRWLAAAAGLTLLLGGGIWQFGMQRTVVQPREADQQDDVALVDEGEIVLDIIGLAEPLDLEAFQVAQL